MAAIPIGKGCRLLYASHGSFVGSSDSEMSGKLHSDQRKVPRVRDTVLLLFPDGKVTTVSIPFPALVRYKLLHVCSFICMCVLMNYVITDVMNGVLA